MEHQDGLTAEPGNLSAEEIQDLVTVATAASVAESTYLMDALDDAGVPVADEPRGTLNFESPEQVIRVPRKLLERARVVIENARAAARDRGIDGAFDEQAVVEAAEDLDPRMQRMFDLRDDSPERRKTELANEIVRWNADGVSDIQAARYLAAAGLNQEEAGLLVKAVLIHRREDIEQSAASRETNGRLLVIFALAVTAASIFLVIRGYSPRIFLWLTPLLFGLILIHSATRKPISLEKREENS